MYVTNHAKVSTAAKLRGTSKPPAFDVQAFLDSTGVARKVVDFRKKSTIFAQGDAAKHVLYIQQGGVKLSLGARLRKSIGRLCGARSHRREEARFVGCRQSGDSEGGEEAVGKG